MADAHAAVSGLVPLTVTVPLIAAALLAAVARWLPRRTPDVVALVVAAAVTVMAAVLVPTTHGAPLVYWFGGWHPVHGLALGVAFVVEPGAAAMAALAGLLTVASLVFSWRYFEEVGYLYHALVLALLAGMVGFALSADLFNIFVWLELMSVAAYALCGYRIQQPGIVQGAMTFAVLTTVGTLTLLFGIALVYGRTGALNLAQIGETLRTAAAPGHPAPPSAGAGAGGTVIVAFCLITVGLLVKAGAVPFHFWLTDAYTVVPAPVGALFAGLMSDLAYHTFAVVYWDGFSEALGGHHDAVRNGLLAFAVASVAVGGVMALLEAELKRQLAFATVAHGGVVLAGIALLTPHGTAGATLFVITAGLLRAALFLLLGGLVQWLGGGDELLLHGRGRVRRGRLPGVLFLCCALGFALPPPFGPFLSGALVVDAAGGTWLPAVVAFGAAATGAVFLRSAARIFLGWGPARDPLLTREPTEPEEGEPQPHGDKDPGRWRRAAMLGPSLVLVVVAYGLSFVPGLADWFTSVAHSLQQPHRTAARVLDEPLPAARPGPGPYAPGPRAWLTAAASAAGAVALAAATLWRQRAAAALGRVGPVVGRVLVRPVTALKAVHDGALGDYGLWFVAGLAVAGAGWGLTLR